MNSEDQFEERPIPSVNRAALIITPKLPYAQWANQLPDRMDCEKKNPYTPEEMLGGEPTVYLIPEPQSNNNFAWVDRNWSMLFDLQLEGWCMEQNWWPKKRTKKLFYEWFNVTVSSLVLDLADEEQLEHDTF